MEQGERLEFTTVFIRILPIVVVVTALLAGLLKSLSALSGVLGGGFVAGSDFVFTSYVITRWFRPGVQRLPLWILMGMSFKLLISGLLLFLLFRFVGLDWLSMLIGITAAVLALIMSAGMWAINYRRKALDVKP